MGPLLPPSPMSSVAALHAPPQGPCLCAAGQGQGSCTCPIPLLHRILRRGNDLCTPRPSQVGPNHGLLCPDPPAGIAPRWAFPHPSVWFTQTETHPPGAQDFDGDTVCLATRSPMGTRRTRVEPDSPEGVGRGRESQCGGWTLKRWLETHRTEGLHDGAGDRGLWEDWLTLSPGSETPQVRGIPSMTLNMSL